MSEIIHVYALPPSSPAGRFAQVMHSRSAADFFSIELLTLTGQHYHWERNHQGGSNRLITPGEPAVRPANGKAPVERRDWLGGLLNFYYQARRMNLRSTSGQRGGSLRRARRSWRR